ncbi:MAG: class I SAM-dependent methyltransferase [Candidatus Hermodarchaeota archaeon]
MKWEFEFDEKLKWTAELRNNLYIKSNLAQKRNLLEIGCVTGELLKEIGVMYDLKLYGIDNDAVKIEYAKVNLEKNMINAKLMVMNISNNSFEDKMFDVIISYFTFLWIKDLKKAISEIHRILTEDGIFLILGEPDFGGLIEYPDCNLKKEIMYNIKNLGGDPAIGRKLNQYFTNQFKVIEHFCTSLPWIPNIDKVSLHKEIDFYEENLNPKQFDINLMRASIDSEKYFLFIPIFCYHLRKI